MSWRRSQGSRRLWGDMRVYHPPTRCCNQYRWRICMYNTCTDLRIVLLLIPCPSIFYSSSPIITIHVYFPLSPSSLSSPSPLSPLLSAPYMKTLTAVITGGQCRECQLNRTKMKHYKDKYQWPATQQSGCGL